MQHIDFAWLFLDWHSNRHSNEERLHLGRLHFYPFRRLFSFVP